MKEHTSKELSQRLHDKGFCGSHTHVWVYHYCKGNMTWTLCLIDEDDTVNKQIPAYTFSGIWSVLPETIVYEETHWLTMRKTPDMTVLGYSTYNTEDHWAHWVAGKNLADIAGDLLEWLIDNKLMEVEG